MGKVSAVADVMWLRKITFVLSVTWFQMAEVKSLSVSMVAGRAAVTSSNPDLAAMKVHALRHAPYS